MIVIEEEKTRFQIDSDVAPSDAPKKADRKDSEDGDDVGPLFASDDEYDD